jgi:hypothetical protein
MSTDQLAKWKAALATSKRQQRNRRGRRRTGLDAVNGPGMIRIRRDDGDRGDGHHPGGQ